jgi:hypothetical protein
MILFKFRFNGIAGDFMPKMEEIQKEANKYFMFL